MVLRALCMLLTLPLLAACGSDSEAKADGERDDAGATDATVDAGPPRPKPEFLPVVTGTCPEFVEGTVSFEFGDGKTRDVQIWVGDEAKTLDGPLVYYWHGTGSFPGEAIFGLEQSAIDRIKAAGGIVASPSRGPGMGAGGVFPWYLTLPGTNPNLDDLDLADQILACSIEKIGIDTRRVHTTGISAGALHSAQMAWRRSGYLASVAPISGGLNGAPVIQDAENAFAGMVIFGGEVDAAFGLKFADASRAFETALRDAGHFAFLCDHGKGHPPGALTGPDRSPPEGTGPAIVDFFFAHPYGAAPSPWAEGLPAGFLDFCAL